MTKLKEIEVTPFIANLISKGEFYKSIRNRDSFQGQLNDRLESYKKMKEFFSAANAIKANQLIRVLNHISLLNGIELIDDEYPLLNTPSGLGRKPSADILAIDSENKVLFLIEIKVSDRTTREAVTELSAYSQGLNNRYPFLSTYQLVWIPISTDWRVTSLAGILYQFVFSNISCIPLDMDIYKNSNGIEQIDFNLFNFFDELPERFYQLLFLNSIYDSRTFTFFEEPFKVRVIFSLIKSITEREKLNGFTIYSLDPNLEKSNLNNPSPFIQPYQLTISIVNPFKYAIKQLEAKILTLLEVDEYRVIERLSYSPTNFVDINFKTGEEYISYNACVYHKTREELEEDPNLEHPEILKGYRCWEDLEGIDKDEYENYSLINNFCNDSYSFEKINSEVTDILNMNKTMAIGSEGVPLWNLLGLFASGQYSFISCDYFGLHNQVVEWSTIKDGRVSLNERLSNYESWETFRNLFGSFSL